MTGKLSYCWRLIGTAIGFASFGLGGILLGYLVIPCLCLLIRETDARAAAIRSCIHSAFRLYIAMIRVLGVLTFELHGKDRLDEPGLLLIANHPTLLDIVFLISFVKNAVCVVKESLITNPYVGFVIRSAHYISNVDPAGSIEECIAALDDDVTVVIFPEGTRTANGGRIRLQRGAAYVAMQSGKPLTPISISCEPATLSKEENWYEIPERKMHYIFTVEDDLVVDDSLSAPTRALAARRVTDAIREKLFRDTINGRA